MEQFSFERTLAPPYPQNHHPPLVYYTPFPRQTFSIHLSITADKNLQSFNFPPVPRILYILFSTCFIPRSFFRLRDGFYFRGRQPRAIFKRCKYSSRLTSPHGAPRRSLILYFAISAAATRYHFYLFPRNSARWQNAVWSILESLSVARARARLVAAAG